MKRTRRIFTLLLLVFVIDGVGIGFAQPIIPREAILSHTPADVKQQIERLYSSSPLDRADAAHCLGNMGERAVAAAPFLVGLLGDRADTVVLPSDSGQQFVWERTSPGKEAEKALAKIGRSYFWSILRVF